jgi:hypothetical protein
MQQEIKLTNESSNTVFVDDVDVSKGVYAKHNEQDFILYVGIRAGEYMTSATHYDNRFDDVMSAFSLMGLIETTSRYTFYTIPDNKRIVTEREVTIDDLKNTDHVGFVDEQGDKGYVVYAGAGRFMPITNTNGVNVCNCVFNSNTTYSSISESLQKSVHESSVYRFTTRKELYQWLAE